MTRILSAALVTSLLGGTAMAQDAVTEAPPPPVAVAPAPEPVAVVAPAAAASALKITGLMDTYYLYKLTGDSSTEAPAGRAFDSTGNNFALNYARLGFDYQTDMAGFTAVLGYGNMNSAALPIVQQGFATIKPSSEFKIEMGRFATWAGAEVIEANANWMYSRSLLFNGISLLHEGVRAVYTAGIITAGVSLTNNLYGATQNGAANKTVGATVIAAIDPTTSVAGTVYVGKDTGTENQIQVDIVGSKTLSDALALNLNVDYFKAGEANWFGVAGMGKFTLGQGLYLAGRGEFIKAKNGYSPFNTMTATFDGSLYSVAALVSKAFGSNAEVRAELRFDGSDKDTAFKKGADNKKNQATGLISFLAYFGP